jgi:hypothetical protein
MALSIGKLNVHVCMNGLVFLLSNGKNTENIDFLDGILHNRSDVINQNSFCLF